MLNLAVPRLREILWLEVLSFRDPGKLDKPALSLGVDELFHFQKTGDIDTYPCPDFT